MSQGIKVKIPTIKGKLVLETDREFVAINDTILNWMQLQVLRNKLTKMIDNKRASDRLKWK